MFRNICDMLIAQDRGGGTKGPCSMFSHMWLSLGGHISVQKTDSNFKLISFDLKEWPCTCMSLKRIRTASFSGPSAAAKELEQCQTPDNTDIITNAQINLLQLRLWLTTQSYMGWRHMVVLLWGEDFLLYLDNTSSWVHPLHLSDMTVQKQVGGGCSWKLALIPVIRLDLTTVITT